ncbi:hypothetical protein D1007_14672 [Hordeum vulgare]|nr:hypothetical protein D1007_14672 [Hordeum vulgare]
MLYMVLTDYMVTIDGYQCVPQDENSLEKAVANQPVVVDAASGGVDGWMNEYTGGIADCHHETPYSELDHSMLAVAYGTEKSDSVTGCKDHQKMALNLQGAYAGSDVPILSAPSTPAGKTSTTGVGGDRVWCCWRSSSTLGQAWR